MKKHTGQRDPQRQPPEAIPGCLAGPGLLAEVIVSKGADHLPLYRLEGIFERQGVKLSRQTMDGWWLQTAEFLQPLYTRAVRLSEALGLPFPDTSWMDEPLPRERCTGWMG